MEINKISTKDWLLGAGIVASAAVGTAAIAKSRKSNKELKAALEKLKKAEEKAAKALEEKKTTIIKEPEIKTKEVVKEVVVTKKEYVPVYKDRIIKVEIPQPHTEPAPKKETVPTKIPDDKLPAVIYRMPEIKPAEQTPARIPDNKLPAIIYDAPRLRPKKALPKLKKLDEIINTPKRIEIKLPEKPQPKPEVQRISDDKLPAIIYDAPRLRPKKALPKLKSLKEILSQPEKLKIKFPEKPQPAKPVEIAETKVQEPAQKIIKRKRKGIIKNNIVENKEDFNQQMRDYLSENNLMPKFWEDDSTRPLAYKRTGFVLVDAFKHIASGAKKLFTKPHIKARKEKIIKKRISNGCWDRETALNSYLKITPEKVQKKMHLKRYAEMGTWTPEEWEAAKMTRKEFMENRYEYMIPELSIRHQKRPR